MAGLIVEMFFVLFSRVLCLIYMHNAALGLERMYECGSEAAALKEETRKLKILIAIKNCMIDIRRHQIQ